MPVNSVNSTNTYIAGTIENPNNDANINAYNELSNQWSTYSSNSYLSDKFKEEIKKKLEELKGLINLPEEEKKNEEIAKSIAALKTIINGSDSMISLRDRVKCLEDLSTYSNYLTDAETTLYDSFYAKLNSIDATYKDTKTFYNDLLAPILESQENLLSSKNYNTLKENIANGKYSSTETSKAFFDDLMQCIVSYSVHQTEQNNISASSRASLSNKTLSMKVMQESNAYKVLEMDNLMSEELNKRAEMDPALKRLRDGIYWADNKEIKAKDNINTEDELWTKKQE